MVIGGMGTNSGNVATAEITITLPSHWVFIAPCGCFDGSIVSVRLDGTICAASAEDAWKQFTPNKRSRDKEARDGWTCRGVTAEERGRFLELFTAPCEHKAVAS